MPISDPDPYVKGHFKHVYEDILVPACDRAGFKAIRADHVKQTNLIHLDVLEKLLETPMAVCDLSSLNPNVLFEVALRQAFDRPVALVQEVKTPAVFDIAPFRYTEYRKERTYHEVLEDQLSIAAAIKETFDAHSTGKGVNSIVKLLALSKPAAVPEINAPEALADIQQLILAQIGQLRDEMRSLRRSADTTPLPPVASRQRFSDLFEIFRQAERLAMRPTNTNDVRVALDMLNECRTQVRYMMSTEESSGLSVSDRDYMIDMARRIDVLADDIHRAKSDKLVRDKKK
jgi:hypothetical protein